MKNLKETLQYLYTNSQAIIGIIVILFIIIAGMILLENVINAL